MSDYMTKLRGRPTLLIAATRRGVRTSVCHQTEKVSYCEVARPLYQWDCVAAMHYARLR